MDFKTKNVTRDKGYFMMKGSVHQKDKTVINIYVSNNTLKIQKAKTNINEGRTRQVQQ